MVGKKLQWAPPGSQQSLRAWQESNRKMGAASKKMAYQIAGRPMPTGGGGARVGGAAAGTAGLATAGVRGVGGAGSAQAGGGSLQDRLYADWQNAFEQARAANEARSEEIRGLYSGIYEQTRQDVRERGRYEQSVIGQEMVGRGMGAWTRGGKEYQGFSGQYLPRAMGERETSAEMRRIAADEARLTGGFLERQEDVYPDYGFMAQLLQQAGQGAGLSNPWAGRTTGGGGAGGVAGTQAGGRAPGLAEQLTRRRLGAGGGGAAPGGGGYAGGGYAGAGLPSSQGYQGFQQGQQPQRQQPMTEAERLYRQREQQREWERERQQQNQGDEDTAFGPGLPPSQGWIEAEKQKLIEAARRKEYKRLGIPYPGSAASSGAGGYGSYGSYGQYGY